MKEDRHFVAMFRVCLWPLFFDHDMHTEGGRLFDKPKKESGIASSSFVNAEDRGNPKNKQTFGWVCHFFFLLPRSILGCDERKSRWYEMTDEMRWDEMEREWGWDGDGTLCLFEWK